MMDFPPTAPSPAAPGSGTLAGSVWVSNDGGDSLSVIDAATNALTVTLRGLTNPHNIQVGLAGTAVYATDTSDRVVTVDPATYTVAAVAGTGSHPAHAIEAPNGRVYVTNAGDATVSVYHAGGLQPAKTIQLTGMPHGLRAAPNGWLIVVADMPSGALDLIDPADDRRLGSIPVGPEPVQVAVSADGRHAYATVTDPPAVVKVDLVDRKVVGAVPVSARPVQLYLTPDDATVLSADEGTPEQPGNQLSVIDTDSMTVRQSITVGSGPHGVVIDDSGARAYVTNRFDDTVSVVDLAGHSLIATVPVGPGPTGVSYSTRAPAATNPAIALDVGSARTHATQ